MFVSIKHFQHVLCTHVGPQHTPLTVRGTTTEILFIILHPVVKYVKYMIGKKMRSTNNELQVRSTIPNYLSLPDLGQHQWLTVYGAFVQPCIIKIPKNLYPSWLIQTLSLSWVCPPSNKYYCRSIFSKEATVTEFSLLPK